MATHPKFDQSPLSPEQLTANTTRLADLVGREDVIEDVYGLSPLQEAMYFHAIASEADDLYVIQQRLEISGPLDLAAFQSAWSMVVDHHPALRTVFVWDQSGPPAQIVCRGIGVTIEFTDLTGMDRGPLIEAAIDRDRRTRFTLDAPPVMRLLLFKTDESLHELVWSQHHLLEDGWSATHVLQEVFAAYEALVAGEAPELAPSKPYAEYIRWLDARDGETTEAFWREHFDGFSRPTRLGTTPTDDGMSDYVRIGHSVGRDLSDAIRAFARERRLTLNTVLVGAMTVLLSRYVGRTDVALGVVASGRPYTLPGVESMVGMFINTLALRVPVEPDAPVADWLRTVQNRQADVIEHEYTPLTAVQGWTDLGAGVTLTDTLFAFWGFGGADMSPGRTLQYRTTAGYGRTSFPVSFTVEATDIINVEMDFDIRAFDRTTGEALLAHYATLLGSMVDDPTKTVRSLQMLTPDEQESIALTNATTTPVPHRTVVEAFHEVVRRSPDAVAVRDGERTMTYRDLDSFSHSVADLVRDNVGDTLGRIGIHMARSVELIGAILGVLEAGGSYVPMDRHHPAGRVEFVLEDSGADLVLTDQHGLDSYPLTSVVVDAHDDRSSGPATEPGFDDEAYVMYTSGSTGTPKGVMVSHANLINYLTWAHATYGDSQPVTFPFHTSPAFDLTITSIFVPLISGGEIVVYPDDSARDLSVIDVFTDDLVDVVKLTPSHLALLQDVTPGRISRLVVGGEELTTELARSVGDHFVIYNEYGPTETTVGCMIHRFDPVTDVGAAVPIGAPIANTQVFVLDESLSDVPAGFAGDLYVGGTGVTRGYLGRESMTDAAFVQHPITGALLYRTGDRAKRSSDGQLEFLGRADDQMKLRGFRIEPGEIESVLTNHPAVANAAIAIREPHPGDQRLVAYYVTSKDSAPNVTALREHLRQHLPEYMTPQHLVRVDSLPLTTNGKLDRDALPDTIGDVARTAGFRRATGPREELVAGIAADLLGTDSVSMRDNFFDLGGHSILAMQFIARLHADTGHRLSPRVLLLNTLEQAAAALPAPAGNATVPPNALDESGQQTVETSAFFFGPTAEPLFGIHYAPTGGVAQPVGVLICPPIGWEYMRTHWASRKLARLLVRDGFHVLRFDYFATGDSAGNSDEGSLERWIADIGSASSELMTVSGLDRIAIVGIRHGATLSALAASAGLDVDRLVMWDPVVDGDRYMDALEAMHQEMLTTRGGPKVPIGVSGDELLGTPYPAGLRASLRSIDLRSSAPRGVLIASRHDDTHRDFVEASGDAISYEIVEDAGDWSDLASAQAALLPTRIPIHIARLLAGSR